MASSLLHVGFWAGWYGPQGWRAGLLSPEDQAAWEAYDRSFVALAGLEWRIQMRAIEAARRQLDPARFLEIKYESFCEQPMETYRRVLEFADLPWTPAFEREVQAASIRSQRDRWRADLTPAAAGACSTSCWPTTCAATATIPSTGRCRPGSPSPASMSQQPAEGATGKRGLARQAVGNMAWVAWGRGRYPCSGSWCSSCSPGCCRRPTSVW